MKWSITQLRKYQGKPFEFDQTVSFDNLKESLDLIDLSPITIQGPNHYLLSTFGHFALNKLSLVSQ